MKSGKLLLGLLSGAAAGAAVGLLFAPKKGADTRRAISQTGDDYLQGAKGRFNEFSDSLNHKVEALKSKTKANLASSKSKEKAHEAKAEIHNMKAS
ncbi:YtxH domain-containing protein [Salegentibacter chungangensis]|uniref:YtxH domain-containing protein n=1 Tax=Salegentibacter chungangensis TaxID=1335724 RepID=A0ABW3NPF5_9FLAO